MGDCGARVEPNPGGVMAADERALHQLFLDASPCLSLIIASWGFQEICLISFFKMTE